MNHSKSDKPSGQMAILFEICRCITERSQEMLDEGQAPDIVKAWARQELLRSLKDMALGHLFTETLCDKLMGRDAPPYIATF